MLHIPPGVLAVFESQHGVSTRQQLLDNGLSRSSYEAMRSSGLLESMMSGAVRLRGQPMTELTRCAAVCLAHPEAAIAGPTAGRLWGFRRLPHDRRVHVLAPPASHPTIAPWVVAYRTAAIRPHDVVRRSDGIAVTSRARTALDLSRSVPTADLRSVMEQAMNDGGLDVGDMWDVASEWSSPRRPWLDRFLRLLDQRLAGGAAESHPEVVLGEALRRGGVIGLVRQHRIDLPGYGRARFDLAIPHLRWAIEADLFPTHRETIGRWRDADRDEAALAIGWATTRVGPEEFGASFERTVEELVDEYHGRSAAARQLRSDQR